MLKPILLFNTVKYLKYSQIWHRIRRSIVTPKLDLSSSPSISTQIVGLCHCIQRPQSMQNANEFTFLNSIACIADKKDWNFNHDKLWLYNLHYFDDLNATNAAQRTDWHHNFIQKWIDENPPGIGNGWEPYPSSLRIVNWIKWSLLGGQLKPEWMHSLVIQIRFLTQNIEYHLLGNHLFTNAKTLMFAGLLFKGKEADKWYQTGLNILNNELPEQVLEDGGNFELSPMYHAIFLEDLLDLVNIHRVYGKKIPRDIERKISSMFAWLQTMCHPDGGISFFNDATIGIAPTLDELKHYATRLKLPHNNDTATHLKNSGYIRVEKENLVALLDVASIGSDYIPGHAHADTLSFEASWFGKRVVVNSGISCYGNSQERLRQRSTASHNTVVVNGENSSEVWSGFRVARRAKPFNLIIEDTDDTINIACSHDGYNRLNSGLIHAREWHIGDNELIINDKITGKFDEAKAYFHFHPSVKINLNKDNASGVIILNCGNKIYFNILHGILSIANSTYHPEFGISINNKCLVVVSKLKDISIKFNWQ